MQKLLSASEVREYKKPLAELFAYCKSASTGNEADPAFCEGKIDELIAYLSEGRAYLFAELSDGEPIGFLWACRIMRDSGERFHTLYFAVGERTQGRGVGSALLSLAEAQALSLGIRVCELNVHTHNASARRFYEKHGYLPEKALSEERLTLIKELS